MSNGLKRMVALDIGGTKIASALVVMDDTHEPRVLFEDKIPTQAQEGGSQVLARVIESAKRVLAEAAGSPVDGIAVSSGGVIDPVTGDVTYANEMMPGWMGTPLGSALTDEFKLPTRVLNDVHAHALGEARWGAGRNKKTCLVVAVGTGISGAFVDHGQILLGEHNVAGHIGHMSCTEADDIPCTCGARGHVEMIAAGPAILSYYLEQGGDPSAPKGKKLDGAIIDQRAAAGDVIAQAAETRSGHALGEVLANSCNMLDPACVILSGSVVQCGKTWHDALSDGWQKTIMPPLKDIPIISGELGGDAPLIGAAEHLVFSAYQDV